MVPTLRSLTLFALFAHLIPAQGANTAVRMNGSDAYGTAAGVDGLVSDSTWEAWVWLPPAATPQASFDYVLFRWGMYSHGLKVSATGAVAVDMYSCPAACPNGTSAAGAIPAEEWHHLAMVYGSGSGPSCTVYVDGQVVASCAGAACSPYGGWQTVLGASGYIGYANFLDAAVDEARISNVQRYTAPFAPSRTFTPDAHTVGLWHFDEGVGNLAHDASGHGRDFTLHGGFSWVTGNLGTNSYFSAFGVGCLGTAGVPVLDALNGDLPRLGTTFTMRLYNLPNGPVFIPLGFLGYSNTITAGGVPLPASLGILGMPPSCMQRVDTDNGNFYTLTNAGGHADWHVTVPNNPSLDGASVYVQALVFDWSLPYAFPATLTNGGELHMGY